MYDLLVDIDGTIADCEHRIHHIITPGQPKDWHKFHEATLYDAPIQDVLNVVKMLHASGCRLIVCTARGEENRELTVQWLDEIAGLKGMYHGPYMRKHGDFRSDTIVKPEMLPQIRADGFNPVMCFEDRKNVTQAWRDAGLRVFQVVEGDY